MKSNRLTYDEIEGIKHGAFVSPAKCGWIERVAEALKDSSSLGQFNPPHFPECGTEFEKKRAQLVVAIASEVILQWPLAVEGSSTAVHKIAHEYQVKPGFVRLIERELRKRAGGQHQSLEPLARSDVTILLVLPESAEDADPKAIPRRLHLELLPSGTGEIFPHPSMTFIKCDELWNRALNEALRHYRSNAAWRNDERGDPCDVCWSVNIPQDYSELRGSSAGGAARLALDALMAPAKIANGSSLLGIAFVATINKDGGLGRVDVKSLPAKLHAAINHSLPRIHTLVIARAHETEVRKFGLREQDYLDSAKVLFADRYDDAIGSLNCHLDGTWDAILDSKYDWVWRRHEGERLMERRALSKSLLDHWQDFEASDAGGVWMLIANAFFGKSAFAASWFRRGRPVVESSEPGGPAFFVAGHFFRANHELSSVRKAVRSIILQMCQTHGFSPPLPKEPEAPTSEDDMRLAGLFQTTLTKAAAKALDSNRGQLIVLDGLDEADSNERGLLDRLVPGHSSSLPRGVLMLITARPGGEPKTLSSVLNCLPVRLDLHDQKTMKKTTVEIREILGKINPHLTVQLEAATLDRLAEACEGLLGIAYMLTSRNKNLASDAARWRDKPSLIPHGLQDVLVEEWNRVEQAWSVVADLRKRLQDREDACARSNGRAPATITDKDVENQWKRSVQAVLGIMALAGDISTVELAELIKSIPSAAWDDLKDREDWNRTCAEIKRLFDDLNLNGIESDVAGAAEIFFDSGSLEESEGAPRRFFHGSFPQYILGSIPVVNRGGGTMNPFWKPGDVPKLSRLLAFGCLSCYRKSDSPGESFSLRKVCALMRQAAMGREWAELLLEEADEDSDFLARRFAAFGVGELIRDFPESHEEAKAAGMPEDSWVLLDKVRRVLENRGHFMTMRLREMESAPV